MSEWREIEIGEVAKLQGGFAFKGKDFQEFGIPVAKIKNVKKASIDLNDCGFVSPEVGNSSSSYLVKNGDILISMTGSGINQPNSIVGRVARYSGMDNAFLINQRVGRFLIKDNSRIYSRFLYYYLSPEFRQLEFVAISTGSANQVNISGKQIEGFKINLPPLPEQKAIAHILGTLDDKIEINRKMNETLEQMAQALFKSWFVDFDPVLDNALAAGNEIPEALKHKAEKRKQLHALALSSFQGGVPEGGGGKKDHTTPTGQGGQNTSTNPASEANYKPLPKEIMDLFPSSFEFNEELDKWIPEGWEVSTVGQEFNVTMGQSPPGSSYNDEELGMPFFQGKTDFGFRFPTNRIYCTEPKRTANKNDTLISVRAPVGNANLALSDCSIGRGLAAVRHKSKSISFTYYSILQLKEVFDVFEGEGTVFGSINQTDLKNISVIKFDPQILEQYEIISREFDQKIEINENQISSLNAQRDILLPQLISGKLRLPKEMITQFETEQKLAEV